MRGKTGLGLLLLALVGSLLAAWGVLTARSVFQGEVLEDRPPAPDFLLPNVDGGEVSLREFRGKVVAVYMTNL